MVSVLAFVAVIGVCGLMLWGSSKIEPHWVSKDGRRVICYGQGISNRGEPYGRWRELRLTGRANGTVEVTPRRGTLGKDHRAIGMTSVHGGRADRAGGGVRHRGQRATVWKVNGASSDPPPRRIVYLLDRNDDPALPELLAIRLPITSRAVPMLEELALNKSELASTSIKNGVNGPKRWATSRGTSRSAVPPDPG